MKIMKFQCFLILLQFFPVFIHCTPGDNNNPETAEEYQKLLPILKSARGVGQVYRFNRNSDKVQVGDWLRRLYMYFYVNKAMYPGISEKLSTWKEDLDTYFDVIKNAALFVGEYQDTVNDIATRYSEVFKVFSRLEAAKLANGEQLELLDEMFERVPDEISTMHGFDNRFNLYGTKLSCDPEFVRHLAQMKAYLAQLDDDDGQQQPRAVQLEIMDQMMAEKQQMEQVLKAHFTKYTGLSLYNYDLKKLAELECAIRELRESRPKSAATSSCINCLGCGTSSRTAVAQLEMALSAWDKYTIAVKEERLKTLFHLFKEDFATKKIQALKRDLSVFSLSPDEFLDLAFKLQNAIEYMLLDLEVGPQNATLDEILSKWAQFVLNRRPDSYVGLYRQVESCAFANFGLRLLRRLVTELDKKSRPSQDYWTHAKDYFGELSKTVRTAVEAKDSHCKILSQDYKQMMDFMRRGFAEKFERELKIDFNPWRALDKRLRQLRTALSSILQQNGLALRWFVTDQDSVFNRTIRLMSPEVRKRYKINEILRDLGELMKRTKYEKIVISKTTKERGIVEMLEDKLERIQTECERKAREFDMQIVIG